jgi:hypothetical protein
VAVTILGGLVTSTLLSLFILPALYLRLGAARPQAASRPPAEPTTPSGQPALGGVSE